MAAKKKARKKKAMPQDQKTAAVSIRMDPVSKWQLELLSRLERRSMSATIEDAIEARSSATDVPGVGGYDGEVHHEPPTIAQLARVSYSPNDLERLIRLAFDAPALLTYEELRQWEVVKKTAELWHSWAASRFPKEEDFRWDVLSNHLVALQIMIQESAAEPVLSGLPQDELEALGIDLAPITPGGKLPF